MEEGNEPLCLRLSMALKYRGRFVIAFTVCIIGCTVLGIYLQHYFYTGGLPSMIGGVNAGRAFHPKRDLVFHPKGEKCQQRLPKALIIGIQKCGTSALITFLSYHPQISAVLHPGEVRFFTGSYNKGLDWYRKKMNCSYSNQIPIEKSPQYFLCNDYPQDCAKKIKVMDPNIKLILIVKDPITRTQSAYAMVTRDNKTHESYQDMLINPNTGEFNLDINIFKYTKYAESLAEWLKVFSLAQFLIIDGTALEENPAKELRKVERFLKIGTYFTDDMFVFNPVKGKYCVKTGSTMSCLPAKKGRKHPDIPPAMFEKLKRYFHPMNERFFQLLGRRFDWGY